MPHVTSSVTAATQFVETELETYAYRRFGSGAAPPLVCLQHFTGTLDNWDPAVTDPLARGREVILFESAGLGRSTGEVPDSVRGMAEHALAFADALMLLTYPDASHGSLFPSKPVSRFKPDRWLRNAEKRAGLEPQRGSAWHAFRRAWATQRKHLPAVDVAKAGGWATVAMVTDIYQQADQETTLQVVLGGAEIREVGGR